MKPKYIIIGAKKTEARRAFINGDFMTWTEKNLKSAFNFGKGSLKDFRRFLRDNAGNTTAVFIDSLAYIDSGEPCDISRDELENVFFKYGLIL